MEPFIERIIDERKELVERKDKLNEFIYSQKFMELDTKMKTLIRSQLKVMNQYINILGWRLELLGVKVEYPKVEIKEDEEVVDFEVPID